MKKSSARDYLFSMEQHSQRGHRGSHSVSIKKAPSGGDGALLSEEAGCQLGKVVAEGSPEHVVVRIRRTTDSIPSITAEVGVLRTELDTAFVSVVQLVPEARHAFEHAARGRCAVCG